MQPSKVMDDLRKIRDENSQRHLSQTPEEFSAEMKEAASWFIAALGKEVIHGHTTPGRLAHYPKNRV